MIDFPSDVEFIISLLEKHGHEGFAVGGCVRDSLLLRTPNDWDITTSATPEEVKRIFRCTIDTGIEHGTVTVRLHHKNYEVTTYRVDGDYHDGRHPSQVTYTASLDEDLKRRDFTINAMAAHPQKGVVDLFGGQEDLKAGIIRCVGDPKERFSEDALRMLRALRFAAQLDFKVEAETFDQIKEHSQNISRVSVERIQAEIIKLLVSDHPEVIKDVALCGLSSFFMPELDAMFETEQNSVHHCFNVGDHTVEVLKNLPGDRTLRLAGLLHDVAKPLTKKTDKKGRDHFVGHQTAGAALAEKILRRLKLDNRTIEEVGALVRYHDERPAPTKKNVRRLAARVGRERMEELITLKRADIAGQSDYMREEKYKEVEEIRNHYNEIVRNEDALSVRELTIGGGDLMELGVQRGPAIGEILKKLLEQVVDDPSANTKEELKRRALALKTLLASLIIVLLCGCSRGTSSQSGAFVGFSGADKASEQEEIREELDLDDEQRMLMESDIYLITDISDEEERYILKSLTSYRQFRFAYGLSTRFLDKWGNVTSQTDFVRGSVVKIADIDSNVLGSMTMSDAAWTVEELTNFSYDEDKERFSIGQTPYRLRPTANIYSGDMPITISDVTEDDRLRVVGIDKEVLAVTVTTGHGYIELKNTKFFDDSLISIGTRIHVLLKGETAISVPAGDYRITVAKDGYGGSVDVNVKKDQIVQVDISKLKGKGPKTCRLVFKVSVDNVRIYVDGKEVKKNKEIRVSYGEHKLRVEAEGYDTWEKTLVVNSPSAEISLDPSKEEDESDSKKSTRSQSSAKSGQTAGTTSGSSASPDKTANQAELDYLTTLSNMIDKLTGSSSD